MVGMHGKKDTLSNRLLSVAVLVGFLCIQFHSFAHIDFNSLSTSEGTHQTQNSATTQLQDFSSSDTEVSIDCADCVLTKHLQVSVEEEASLFSDHALGLVTLGKESLLIDSSDHIFQLRAPPIKSFS